VKVERRISANAGVLGVVERSALYKGVFSTPHGEKVLADILNRLCNVDGACFTESPIGMAYNTARRDVGLEIARLVWLEITEEQTPEVKK
jgi:hypothetical protein